MKVVILHPDFGIGGAERLVLDAALALKRKEHDVHIVTNQFSESHCFAEMEDFREKLTVVGQRIPRTILGRCYALCAYIRFCLAAFYICVFHRDADLIVCDQISAPLPILRIFTRASLLFYCHFPDQCLCTDRRSIWKQNYRVLIDAVEGWTMCWAHQILVNSKFTERKVLETFPALAADRPLAILYPSINCEFFKAQIDRIVEGQGEEEICAELTKHLMDLVYHEDNIMFLSINRFERKKNIQLAIHAFAQFIKPDSSETERPIENCILFIAGGYDPLNVENIAHYEELVALVRQLDIENHVKFIRSPSDVAKIWLMSNARLILYTPEGEHFGIVPIEAMYLRVPVLAVDSGGPRETIQHKKTGFLRPADPARWARTMGKLFEDPELAHDLGEAGHQHVAQNFSFDAFMEKLNAIALDLQQHQQQRNDANTGAGEANAKQD